jgi:hypothetical protein
MPQYLSGLHPAYSARVRDRILDSRYKIEYLLDFASARWIILCKMKQLTICHRVNPEALPPITRESDALKPSVPASS